MTVNVLIKDQLDRLQNAEVFPTLDLKGEFFHVSIDENSVKYTAFVLPERSLKVLKRFLKVPFGLCNSLAVF